MRFFGIFALLLLFAYGAVLASGAASAPSGVPGELRGPSATNTFEPLGEPSNSEAPLSPTDVNNDDDEDNEQEVFTQQTHVVPWRSAVAIFAVPQQETIRPSLGHPRGIDDPPRS